MDAAGKGELARAILDSQRIRMGSWHSGQWTSCRYTKTIREAAIEAVADKELLELVVAMNIVMWNDAESWALEVLGATRY